MYTDEAVSRLPTLTPYQKKKFNTAIVNLRETVGTVAPTKLKAALGGELSNIWETYVNRTPNVPSAQRMYIFGGGKPTKCLQCKKPTKWSGTRYVAHCSLTCGGKTMIEKRKEQCLQLYGVENFQSLPEVRMKMSKMMRQHHMRTGKDWTPRKRVYADAIKLLDLKDYQDPNRIYYVYAMVDPRKPGPFLYGHWKFDFEPFYIGKGKGPRAYHHVLHEVGGNRHKRNKIAKILRETGQYPDVCFKRIKMTEREAHELEILLISKIGRSDMREGPLTNMTAGGEGVSGLAWSESRRKRFSTETKLRLQKVSAQQSE